MDEDESPPRRLLILGASARAAAMSAVHAGFQPVCADLFADADLREIAQVTQIDDYPGGLATFAEEIAPTDWFYVGALENSPEIVARVSARHRLLGNPPEVIAGVRDALRVTEFLRSEDFAVLDVRTADNPPPADGRWLRKPLRGAAGRDIHIVNSETELHAARGARYYQQFGKGVPIAATFLASKDRAELVGVTRQLVGLAEWNVSPFGYCGSIGPLELPPSCDAELRRLGNTLATEFHLRGLFGVDLLWDEKTIWPLEINPRYTASVEVVELATGRRLIAEHVAVCEERDAPAATRHPPRFVGKGILFADREFMIEQDPIEASSTGDLRCIADVPTAGTVIHPGEPICTVLATASTFEECECVLQRRAMEVLTRTTGAS